MSSLRYFSSLPEELYLLIVIESDNHNLTLINSDSINLLNKHKSYLDRFLSFYRIQHLIMTDFCDKPSDYFLLNCRIMSQKLRNIIIYECATFKLHTDILLNDLISGLFDYRSTTFEKRIILIERIKMLKYNIRSSTLIHGAILNKNYHFLDIVVKISNSCKQYIDIYIAILEYVDLFLLMENKRIEEKNWKTYRAYNILKEEYNDVINPFMLDSHNKSAIIFSNATPFDNNTLKVIYNSIYGSCIIKPKKYVSVPYHSYCTIHVSDYINLIIACKNNRILYEYMIDTTSLLNDSKIWIYSILTFSNDIFDLLLNKMKLLYPDYRISEAYIIAKNMSNQYVLNKMRNFIKPIMKTFCNNLFPKYSFKTLNKVPFILTQVNHQISNYDINSVLLRTINKSSNHHFLLSHYSSMRKTIKKNLQNQIKIFYQKYLNNISDKKNRLLVVMIDDHQVLRIEYKSTFN